MSKQNGYVGLPPDSSGKRLNTIIHDNIDILEDDNSVHNQVMTLGDATYIERTQIIDEYGAATIKFPNGGFDFDSFGKAKVSQETVLSNFIPEFGDISEKHYVQEQGNVLLEYVPNEKSIRFGVGPDLGDSLVRTSDKYHKYTAGISNTILMTLNPGNPKQGVTKRWGYYDDFNGLYFEQEGLNPCVNIRSNVNGIVTFTKVLYSEMNGDKLDGTGISKIILNHDKSNIYFIEFQWLGIGISRFGISHPNGTKIVMHTFNNANNHNTVYMSSANLPIRHEIFNTEATGSSTELKIHNSTVIQNTHLPDFRGHRFSTAAISLTNSNSSTWTAAFTIQSRKIFKNKINHTATIPLALSMRSTTTINYAIMKNCTFTNELTFNELEPESSTLISLDGILDQPGKIVSCGFFDAGSIKVNLSDSFDYLQEYLNNTGDGEHYTLLFKNLLDGETDSIIGGMCWEELRMS